MVTFSLSLFSPRLSVRHASLYTMLGFLNPTARKKCGIMPCIYCISNKNYERSGIIHGDLCQVDLLRALRERTQGDNSLRTFERSFYKKIKSSASRESLSTQVTWGVYLKP